MFTCQGCGLRSKPREKENKMVMERRHRTYPVIKTFYKRQGKKAPAKKITKQVGTAAGWEIVREIKLCSRCHEDVLAKKERENEKV